MTVMIEMPVLTDNQISARTLDPDRWMTATDDRTKAVCRACPRRWRVRQGGADAGCAGLWAASTSQRADGPHVRVEAAQVIGRRGGYRCTADQPAACPLDEERAGPRGRISKNLTRLCSKWL